MKRKLLTKKLLYMHRNIDSTDTTWEESQDIRKLQ